jgi:capsular polysaccharide export protein
MPIRPGMVHSQAASGERSFLFLQGPITPFFTEVAAGLRGRGHKVHRVNLNLGDWLFWRGPGAVDYTGRPEDWPPWIDGFLAEQAITDLVLLGEQRFYHSVAIAAAKARGIAITVTDYGYVRPDWITLERDGMGDASLFPRDPAKILSAAKGLPPIDAGQRFKDHFPTQALWDVLYHVAMLSPFSFRHFQNHELIHPVWMYFGLGRRLLLRVLENHRSRRILDRLQRRQAPFWIFAMQMETDFSLRAYSHYPDLDTPLEEVITSFAQHAPGDAELLVKLHPLDPCVKNWPKRISAMARKAGIAGRVQVAPRGDLVAMLKAAQGMITVNSTTASRALSLGKPVTFLGRTIFDVPGLSFQGALDDFWTKAAAPDQALRDAFFTLLSSAYMVRGVYYRRPGLDAAVAATVERLDRGLINLPLPGAQPESATA